MTLCHAGRFRRPAFIPEAVKARKATMETGEARPKRRTLQDRYMEEGPEFSWDHRGGFRAVIRFPGCLVRLFCRI
jgi:hypothetical protein